jgi:hypothetical protein
MQYFDVLVEELQQVRIHREKNESWKILVGKIGVGK